MRNLRNSCGGTGCNTPEHDKRLGHSVIKVDVKAKTVYLSSSIPMGALYEYMYTKFSNADDFRIVGTVEITPNSTLN